MASVTYRLKTPTRKETTIIVRFYSKETGALDFSTGEKIPTEHWQGQRVSVKYKKNHDRINKSLGQLECDLLDIWRNNKGASKESLKALITQAVKGTTTQEKKTFISIVQQFIAQYEREKEKTTAGRYKVLLRKLTSFNSSLTLDDIDQNFYDQFKNWLYDNPNPVYSGFHLEYSPNSGIYTMCPNDRNNPGRGIPVGLFDDVVFKYFVNLKTVCAWAEKRGYTVNQCYKSFEIIKREYPVISLTQNELHNIEAITFKVQERHLDVARDFLVLECRTGQRISDLRRFNKSDIVGNRWTFSQKKGARLNQKTVSLPLVGYCAPALVILQKYNYELPKLSEQKINAHIKTVCKLAGITQPISIIRWAGNRKVSIPGFKYDFITTHTGRKTFITIALQFMSPQMVMNITGIRSFNTLKHYAGESELGLVEEGLRKIEDERAIMKKAQ